MAYVIVLMLVSLIRRGHEKEKELREMGTRNNQYFWVCSMCQKLFFCHNLIFICGWNPNRYLQPGVLSWVPDLYIWIPPRYFYLYIFMASQKLRIPKWNLDNEITSKRKSMWMLLLFILFFSRKLQKRRKGRCGVDTDKLQKWQNDEHLLIDMVIFNESKIICWNQ